MNGCRTTQRKARRAIVALFLIALWILVPAFHHAAADHHHNSSTCATCFLATHATVDLGDPAPRIASAAVEETLFVPSQLSANLTSAPDVRAHGSQAPPSA